ncbi:hypothetical protein PS1_019302 [Malus domestica]
MDRLVKPDVKEVELNFKRDQKCSATFLLSNLMHTMSVAVSLSTTDPNSKCFFFNNGTTTNDFIESWVKICAPAKTKIKAACSGLSFTEQCTNLKNKQIFKLHGQLEDYYWRLGLFLEQ